MIKPGDVLENRYEIISTIGKGGMGTVCLARDQIAERMVAVKENVINDRNRQLVMKEADVQRSLLHRAVPKVFDIIYYQDRVYIIMEYIRGKTLKDVISERGVIPEETAVLWYREISDLLRYMHGLPVPVAYRDLKPENIILQDNGTIKVVDFGIAEEYREKGIGKKKIAALTKGYAAPEQYSSQYTFDVRTDIYALGATMHYMLTGKNPQKPPYKFYPVRKLNRDASYGIEFIIEHSLEPNPDRRYAGMDELISDLENIDSLSSRIKRGNLIRFSAMAVSSAFVIIFISLLFRRISQQRENEITSYYGKIAEALQMEEEKNYDRAEELYSEIIKEKPDSVDGYLGTAKIYLERDGSDAALKYVGDVILPGFNGIYENQDFLMLMEQIYLRDNDLETAAYYEERLKELQSE